MDFSSLGASHVWSIPSRGTSDLFCKCDRKTKENSDKIYSEVDVPQNNMGYQNPHSGTCYVGLFVFSHGNYREYLQTALNEPLNKNKTYLFTMYISLADYSSISIDKIGVCFIPGKADYQSSDVITDLSPVYMSIEREVGNDIKNWHRLSVTYKAMGGEQYLLIGSFVINQIRRTKLKAPKEVKSRINQKIERDAYYFIDDVSLVETDLKEPIDTMNVVPDTLKEIHPNSLIILKNVLFRTGEAALLKASRSELDLIVDYLKKNKDKNIEISGHTDNSGNEKSNRKLSTGRAKAVADYLELSGIDRARIIYTGCGSSRPVANNETDEGKQQNRRVEFILR
ncbi:MAG: OmpA-like periplasmic protein [Bacteroidetes bacterium]|nr:OmpA-like periplasmic protein [Bacteroidota bacterium]MDF2453923.1 OmpA-like periplasmic protein [Bacteroidota bacterium]